MERKSKYSLFPARPSTHPREPLPPLPEAYMPDTPQEPPPHLQQSPTIPPQDLLPPHPAKRTPPVPRDKSPPPCPQGPLTPPAEESPSPWPPLNNSWSRREETTSTLNEVPPRVETSTSPKRNMRTPSSSASSSESSLHKPTNALPSAPPPNPRNRPRTVYFHSGLGGAGNYHKAIRENNILRPMTSNRSKHPRFLSSIFGTLGGKNGRRQQQQQQYTRNDPSGSSQSSGESLPLGAAEVMRRKMLGFASEGKSKESCRGS